MKRKPKPKKRVSTRQFKTECGWCRRHIPPNVEVFGGGGKARPGIDLSEHFGQVLLVYLIDADKTVPVAVAGKDSEARREGYDFVYMTCSKACAEKLREAFQKDIELVKEPQ